MPAARGMTMTTTSWTMLTTLLDTGPGSGVLRVSFFPALGVQYQSPRQHLPLRHHLQLQKFLLVSHSVEFITWAINHSPSTFKSYYGIIRGLIVVKSFLLYFHFSVSVTEVITSPVPEVTYPTEVEEIETISAPHSSYDRDLPPDTKALSSDPPGNYYH